MYTIREFNNHFAGIMEFSVTLPTVKNPFVQLSQGKAQLNFKPGYEEYLKQHPSIKKFELEIIKKDALNNLVYVERINFIEHGNLTTICENQIL